MCDSSRLLHVQSRASEQIKMLAEFFNRLQKLEEEYLLISRYLEFAPIAIDNHRISTL